MSPRRKKSEYWGAPKGGLPHPYLEYEDTPLWRSVKKGLLDMEQNQDLELTEWHQYVVGYICQQLAKDKVAKSAALKQPNGR